MPRLMGKREAFQKHLDKARKLFDPGYCRSCGAGLHEGALEELLACVGLLQLQLDELRTIYIDPRPQRLKLRPGEELAIETDWGKVDVSVTADATIILHKDPADQALKYELRGFFVGDGEPK
jgi:hypothetical protein